MRTPQPNEIPQLLPRWSRGDQSALGELKPAVYDELYEPAHNYLRRKRPDHTLQPTALINEAYLRLIKQDFPEWQNRRRFYGVAAQLMRQILVEYACARARRTNAAVALGLSIVTLGHEMLLARAWLRLKVES
jgi:RNA polymerase sigma factor (TIGR02999 family)